MIAARNASADEIEDWPRIVEQCEGNPMHLPAVHLVDVDPEDLRPLVFEREGRVVGCALGIEAQQRRLRGLLRGARHLQLPTAPALADLSLAPSARRALFTFALGQGFERLIVHPTYSDWLVDDDDLAGFRTTSITEFVIDLRGGEEAVSAAMHKQHRKNVRRAQRAELRIEQDDSIAGLLDLRQMQLNSSARASERAEGFGVSDEAFFERLHRHVYGTGVGHVLFACLGERRIAALAWIEGTRRALTVRSGSLPEGYESRAMYLLYDELIRRCIAAGMCELDAGGVPVEASDPSHPQSGLYEFKNGFGGRPVVRHGIDVALQEVLA